MRREPADSRFFRHMPGSADFVMPLPDSTVAVVGEEQANEEAALDKESHVSSDGNETDD